jgi:L-rhamnose mutarotase
MDDHTNGPATRAHGSDRRCFVLRVRPERLDDYLTAHQHVWPEMQRALTDAGWRNYSLFLADQGVVIGYFESDDCDEAERRIAETDVARRWEAAMSAFFVDESSTKDTLPQYFRLD